jgi:hypothetical protein
MRNFMLPLAVAVAALSLPTWGFAQGDQQAPAGAGQADGRQGQARGGGGARRVAPPSPTKNAPFDAHDFSGFWTGQATGFGMGTPAPAMTPWAKARYDAAIPGIGAGAGDNTANPRARPLGNDPIMTCEPIGYPRIILTAGMYGLQIVQTPKEMLWLFDWFGGRREIWTDGRQLSDDTDNRFYGNSVGHWEGDTFIVESNNFDDRVWLDDDGHPYSQDMKLVERFHRVDHDTIEFTMTLTDPKAYAQPWTSGPLRLIWIAPDQLKSGNSGWEDIRQDVCIPSEEAKYRQLVRDPAGGATPGADSKPSNGGR